MREKLLELLKKDCFVSGEHLAKELGVSRTAIWKQIKILRDVGYEIQSVKNKGYKLISRPDIPIPEEVSIGLNTKIIGRKIHYFKSISSTNLYAKKLADENAEDGTIVIADVQTSGRGRKNRNWTSDAGGLWFSTVLHPDIPPQQGMLITMTSSIAVAKAIQDMGLSPVIKWPNDLLVNDKKICGILTELDAEMDKINYAIVGIGINTNNMLPKDLKKTATSASYELGNPISRVKFFRSVLKYFDENYNNLKSKKYDIIRKQWLSLSDIIGRKVRVNDEKNIFTGVVADVDQSGNLIIDTKNGFIKLISGDITYI